MYVGGSARSRHICLHVTSLPAAMFVYIRHICLHDVTSGFEPAVLLLTRNSPADGE
jgi:hypothetical protein